ncbi:MAG TPA: PA14 domain-containing protein [Polyangia bacterium]|nr:PA14 domain-containing protein [Polyangia bacterium]
MASCANSSPPGQHNDGSAGAGGGGADRPQDMSVDFAGGTGGSSTRPDSGDDPDGGSGGGGMPVDQRKTLGVSCAANDDCRSGFCVDGVCCSEVCTGACLSCAIKGSVGHCIPAEIGTDPRDQCPDQGLASCGTDGVCDGAGACRKYPSGITCLPATCSGSTMNLASRCDGAGACVPTASQPCAPFTCDSTANTCRTTCQVDGDCTAPNTCVNGSCGKKPLGSACTTAGQCNSGFCEQGTCCGAVCDGLCRSCALPGTAGTCATVPAGQDPLGQCADSGAATCGTDGTCNGAGACRRYLSGTMCAAVTCNAGTESGTRRCDGAGVCQAGVTRPCEPFACGTGGTCLTACTTSADCATSFFCIGGTCAKKAGGATCQDQSECATGFCQQGVCCNRQCTGGCRSCNLPNLAGTCTSVPAGQDPLNQCTDAGATTCGTDGQCDGAGACRLYVTGTICGAGSCSGATQTLASRCNGQGACQPGSTQDCAPFSCAAASGACLMSCTVNSNCSTGNVCVNGSCGKKPIGSTCGADGECSSGTCAQGICCSTACAGTCMSCAVAGSLGKCSAVPDGGDDSQQRCTDKGAPMCNTDGKCDGKGACRLYSAATQCAGATCVGASFTAARSCDGVGVCVAANATTCPGNFQCDTASNVCRTTCTTDAHCTAPNTCIEGVCRKKDLAAGCTSAAQCASGFCEQGVCCASACSGACRSCALPAPAAGTCTPIPAHGASNGACPDDGASSCKRDGLCDGNGNCEQYAAGTTCSQATCATDTVVAAGVCNGSGACQPGSQTSCKPFNCGANAMCKNSCTSNADCVSPSVCLNGVCGGGKSNGAPCTTGPECVSTFCSPQGVCCDTACNTTCVACNIMNSVGTCKNVAAGQPPVVANQCANQGAATCGTDGTCDGGGNCRQYATGTTCMAAVCSSNSFTPARTCSAAHTCQTAAATSCGDYLCNGTGCLTNCVTSADCFGTNKCFAAICGGLKGVYFKNTTWTGTPANTRVDANVDFPTTDATLGFGNSSPFPSDATWSPDGFTVRWTGTLTARFTDDYVFRTLSDDGIAVFINNAVVPGLNNATTVGGDLTFTSTGTIHLTANVPVPIRIDFFENTGWAQAHLSWASTLETGSTATFNIIPTARFTPDP